MSSRRSSSTMNRKKSKRKGKKNTRLVGEPKLQEGQQLSILTGTNTKQIQKELNRYLTSKKIERMFTGITDSLLLNRPDNPVQFVRDFLKNNYPDQCDTTNWREANVPACPLVGGHIDPDSSPELSDGEYDDAPEDVSSANTPARPKWLPNYDMKTRRLAISQASDDSRMWSIEEQNAPGNNQWEYHGPSYIPNDESSDDDEGGRPGAPADNREMTMDDLVAVLNDKSTYALFLKFVLQSDSPKKITEEKDLRFLNQVEKYKFTCTQPSQARYIKERCADILNDFIVRGSEKQINMEPKIRSATEYDAREPTKETFDRIRLIVLERILESPFVNWIGTFRDLDDDDEDSDPEDVDVPDDAVITLLQQHPLFAHMPISTLKAIQGTFEMVPVKKKSPIVEYGAQDDKFFIVAKGRCQVFIPRKEEEKTKLLYEREKAKQKAIANGEEVKDSPILRKILGRLDEAEYKLFQTLGPGDYFGELGLLYKSERSLLVRTHADFHATLWMCSRKGIKRAIIAHAQKQRIQRAELLAPVQVLSSLTQKELWMLADVAEELVFSSGEILVEQGEMSDKLIIVVEGGLRLYQKTPKGKKIPLAILKKNMWIGEMALMTRRLSQADVVALSDCRCLVLTRKKIEFILGPLLDLIKKRDARHYLRLLQLAI